MSKVIDNYVLMEVVGSGQYGKVYKAKHIHNNKIVAIKVLKLHKFKQVPKLHQFTINQIQTLSKIQNPHVIKFLEMLKTNNNMYLVYQFCSGGTLQQLLTRKKRLTQYKTLRIFQHILSAFKSLTKANILHRDIKPSNILLHEGFVKIADFGFCKSLPNKDMANTMVGSPIYMAPQVLKGISYTTKADIWSLGVVLFECLFGFCPYQDRSIAKLIGLIDSKQLIIPHNLNQIHKKTQQIIRRMLCIKPQQRISWQQLFSIDLNYAEAKTQRGSSNQTKKTQKENKKNVQHIVTDSNREGLKEKSENISPLAKILSEVKLQEKNITMTTLKQRIFIINILSCISQVQQKQLQSSLLYILNNQYDQLKKANIQFIDKEVQMIQSYCEKFKEERKMELYQVINWIEAKGKEKMVLTNTVLDTFMKQEFIALLQPNQTYDKQKYICQIKMCSQSQLQKIIDHKVTYLKLKYNLM